MIVFDLQRFAVYGSSYNDTLETDGYNSYVYAYGGNDSIYNYWSDYVKIYGGDGYDTVHNYLGYYAMLDGGASADLIINRSGYYASIYGGEGNDFISLDGGQKDVTVNAGRGDDLIYGTSDDSYGVTYQLTYGDGTDIVYKYRAKDTISIASSYLYTTLNSGNNVLVSIYGGGAMSLSGAKGTTLNIKGGIFSPNTAINVSNYGKNSVVSGTSYADTINNYAGGAKIYGNGGNDYIYNSTNSSYKVNNSYGYVTISGGDGNDTIKSYDPYVSISGGAGNDLISVYSGSYTGVITVNGGTGNDLIYGDTASAGSGVIYQLTYGDGTDIVYNYKAIDTISIASNYSYTTLNSDNNILVSIYGGGAMSLSGAKGTSLNIRGGAFSPSTGLNVSNYGKNSVVNGTSYADTINNYAGGAKIYAGGGNDSIYNSTSSSYTINNSYGYVTIDGGDGNDTITSYDPYVSINGGAGADKISLGSWRNITVKGGTGNDTVFTYSDRTNGNIYQFSSGDGNDVITNWSASDSVSLSGGYYSTVVSGSNVVVSMRSGYSGSITLQGASNKAVNIKGGTLYSDNHGKYIYNNTTNSLLSGTSYADTIDNSGGGVTIRGGDGNDSIYSSTLYTVKGSYGYVTIDGGDGNDTISSYDPYVSINGGTGNDSIKLGSWSGITVKGGTGNDTIATNSGRSSGVIYQFSSGDGNDVITNWSASDSVSLSGGYYSTVVSGSNVVVNMKSGYSGNITLQGAKGKAFNIVGGTLYGSDPTPTLTGGKNISNYNSNVTLTGTAYVDTLRNYGGSNVKINAAGGNDTIYNNGGSKITISGGDGADMINDAYADTISIDGGAGNDSIYGNNNYATITGGTGYDTIVGNHYRSKIYGGTENDFISLTSYSYNTIDGGDGNDTIYAGGNGHSVFGGAGADKISLSGSNLTVRGGTGNDTIYGATNTSHLYQFSSGDGNDSIVNWSNSDTVSLSGGYYSTVVSGSNVVLNMSNGYSGSITLSGAKGKTVKIVGGTLRGSDPTPPTLPSGGGGGNGGGGSSGSTVSQQEVIKKFMKALDTTNNSSTAALNEAVKAASGGYFTNINAVINSMVEDCRRTNNATTFLKNYCGIDLNNSDTGAITGLDAGGSTVAKTASGIVPESGTVNSFTGSSFTTNGLTVKLANLYNIDNSTNISYSSLTNNTQRYIWQAFQTWWASGSLNLIAQSYGNNYGFSSSSSATVKEMQFGFVNENDNALATTWNWSNKSTGKVSKLAMTVNMKYYNALTIGNVDGKSSATDAYLDRTLAHEFTHAVMAANINYFNDLPQFITEGMAELTHGIDDERKSTILALAGNSTRLKNALPLTPGTGTSDAYSGGYMFLRYLAKQGSLNYPSSSSSANVATSRSVSNNIGSGSAGSSLVTLKSGLLTLSKDFNDDMLDMNEYSSAKNVNATSLANGIMIVGNKNANSISAGIGGDTISANTGNDTVRGGAGNDIILGDAGNDNLSGDAGNDTLSGGSGNDTLTGGAGKDFFIHVADSDFIVDYISGEDKIKLAEEHAVVTSSTISGNNVILDINGVSKITVKDGANKNITVIDGNGKETTKKYTSTPVTLLAVTDSSSNNVTVGADTKIIDASSRTKAVKITGNALDNTITGGKGADTLAGGAGKDVFVYTAGKDVITDYAAGDVIKFSDPITKTALSKSDVVFTTKGGTLTVKNGKGATLSLVDSTGKSLSEIVNAANSITYVATNSTASPMTLASAFKDFDASSRTTAIKVLGNDSANSITGTKVADSLSGGKGADTLAGGAGNDTLTGGDGKDVFVYTAGKDVITDYKVGEDTIKLSGAISKAAISGSNVTFTIGSGTLQVNGAKDKTISMIDSSGKGFSAIVNATNSMTYVANNSTESTMTLGSAFKNFNASSRTTAIKVTGNTLANTISGGTNADWIYGGAGNDSILGNAGNDKLFGDAGNDSLRGGAGNDTLTGGKGDDHLWGDAGKDTFLYSNGDGKDVIHGFEKDDLLQITGTFSASYNKSKKEIAFKVGSTANAITLKDFGTTTTFHVNSYTYQLQNNTLTKK